MLKFEEFKFSVIDNFSHSHNQYIDDYLIEIKQFKYLISLYNLNRIITTDNHRIRMS
jgi:hypothetical protein